MVMCGLPHSLLNGLGLSRCGVMAAKKSRDLGRSQGRDVSFERRHSPSPDLGKLPPSGQQGSSPRHIRRISTHMVYQVLQKCESKLKQVLRGQQRGDSVDGGGHYNIPVDPVLSPEGICCHVHDFNRVTRYFLPSFISCDRHTARKGLNVLGSMAGNFTPAARHEDRRDQKGALWKTHQPLTAHFTASEDFDLLSTQKIQKGLDKPPFEEFNPFISNFEEETKMGKRTSGTLHQIELSTRAEHFPTYFCSETSYETEPRVHVGDSRKAKF